MLIHKRACTLNVGKKPIKIAVVPDTQVKPGVDTDHLEWAGRYIAEKRPDVIVHLGDHWDMVSLNIYEKGLKASEGRTYAADIKAGNDAMERFVRPIREKKRKTEWRPHMVFLLGNHCQRIWRAVESDRKLEYTISYDDLNLKDWGVYDFLVPVEIAGILFSHYMISGSMGKAVSSATAMLKNEGQSCIQGHNQKFEIATNSKTNQMGIFAGAFYAHDEEYLTPQGQDHRRHILFLHEAKDGIFDLMQVSLGFLRKKYQAATRPRPHPARRAGR